MRWLTAIQLLLLLLIIELARALIGPGHIDESQSTLQGKKRPNRVDILIEPGNRSAESTIAVDTRIFSYLESKSQEHDAIFTEAVHLLDSMKSSPSCNRVAATRLVTTCQSVGGKDTGDLQIYETLDRIRSMYAARLAICELDGTGASVPAPCLAVTVSPLPAAKSRFAFMNKARSPETGTDLVPKEVLEHCLRVLVSRPQWWTSYSNNRQNAIVICQAARIETEREELLDLHRAIVKTSFKLHEKLGEALRNAAMETSQHHTFLEEVRAMQERTTGDMEESASRSQNSFGKLLVEIQFGLDRIATSASSVMDHLRGEAGVLEKVTAASHHLRS